MELSAKKQTEILQEIQTILKARAIQHKSLEKLQGKLVHAAMGVPGRKGLLSPIYKAVATKVEWITLDSDAKQCLEDWKTIIRELAKRPTSALELVPRLPYAIGYIDASGTTAGGVWSLDRWHKKDRPTYCVVTGVATRNTTTVGVKHKPKRNYINQ